MRQLTDIEISQAAQLQDIRKIATKLDLDEEDLELYGKYKAKIALSSERLAQLPFRNGKLILVTSINPTPAGEGKTTVSIGLADSLSALGHKTLLALREPSLGPCLGLKGGATGGGYAQVVPMEDINLHFTGDLHAVTAAHNLIAAMIDNHIYHGNSLQFDVNRISWKRVMDMNDRSLRQIISGLGGTANGIPRESGFEITVASEIMAILCLAQDITDLRTRIANITLGINQQNMRITVADINATGAVVALLKDAFKPNLVQTLEGTPCLMHGGPFANIAHGCSSIAATKVGLQLADYVVTEAGFGADLGAEKFIDIKCRIADIAPAAVVIVATIRSLKMNGGVAKSDLSHENPAAVKQGLENLAKHLENLQALKQRCVIALNSFTSDFASEVAEVYKIAEAYSVAVVATTIWQHGAAGGMALASEVLKLAACPESIEYAYAAELPLIDKITAIAQKIYGAKDIVFTRPARKKLDEIIARGGDSLLVCIAKTQYSLSDDPQLLGRPTNFTLTIRDLRLASGAGMVIVYAGEIMTMPGLPKIPVAELLGINESGKIYGLF